MNIIQKLYDFVVFMEICLFIPFVLQNMSRLQTIPYDFYIGTLHVEFELNMYITIGAIIIIYGVILLASNNLVGLNEEGSKLLSRLVGTFILQTFLTVISAFYLTKLGTVGLIIILINTIIFGLQMVNTLTGGGNDVNGN